MAGEGEEFVFITRALESLKLADKYLGSFKEHCFGDDLAKDCLQDSQNMILAGIIADEEDRKLFAKVFQEAYEEKEDAENVPPTSTGETGPDSVFDSPKVPESKSPAPVPVPRNRSVEERASTGSDGGRTDRGIWGEMAKSQGWIIRSETAVKRKLHAEALEVQKQAYLRGFENVGFLKDEEIDQHIQVAADAALKFMEDILEPVDGTIRDKELEKLEKSLEKQGEDLKKDNFDRQAATRKKLTDDMEAIWKKYEAYMKRELGDGMVNKEEYAEADDAVVAQLLEEFKHQCSDNPFYSEENFEKGLSPYLDQFLAQLEQINVNIQRKTAELAGDLAVMYHQHLEKISDLNLFDARHQETVSLLRDYALKYEDLDKDSRKVSWETFLGTLEDTKTKAEDELRKRVSGLNEKQLKLRQELVKLYTTRTGAVYTKPIPIAEVLIQKVHQNTKNEVFDKLKAQEPMLDGIWKMSAEEKEIKQRQLEEELDLMMSQALAQNKLRWAAFEKDVEALFEELVDGYVDRMCSLAESVRTEDDWDTKEATIRQHYLKQLEAKLTNKVLDNEYKANATQKLDVMLVSEKDGCLEVFRTQQKEKNLQHKAGMTEAKKYYNEEMELRFHSKEWWNEPELRLVHEQILTRALVACRETVELSEIVEQDLKKGFESIFKGYLEKNKLRTPNREPAIGIDLGTTYSCVGVYYNGAVQIIPNSLYDGKSTVASYVAFDEGGRIVIGNEAKERAFRNPINTIFDAKRLIGRKFDDTEVQGDVRLWPFDVVSQDNEPRVKVKDQMFRPEEISAKVLAYLKNIAEDHLKRPVRKAVITVPAYFNDGQRKATKDAAEIAGLEASIINEPTAAALAYQLNRTGDAKRNVLVFDLGGGTFDVVVISMEFGKVEVISVNGDTHLGGEDFDNAMVDALVERVKQKFNIDLARGRNSSNVAEKLAASTRLRRMKSACEDQKRLLSETKKVEIHIDLLDGDFTLDEIFTRHEFNAINMERFQRCIKVVEKALKDAKLEKTDVDDVVLVGGSTRIPKVQELLKDYFGEQQTFCRRINADEAVAYGAAFQAALLHGDQIHDERNRLRLKDVTPYSLGIEVVSKELSVILAKNTPIPCSHSRNYVTVHDNQTSFRIDVFEGEKRIAKENNLLGTFHLNGIPPKPAGIEGHHCTMTIDSEGILHVESVSESNGRREKIVIEEHRGRMSVAEKNVAKAKPLFRWK